MRVFAKTVLVLAATATAAIGQVVTPLWVQRLAPWGTEGNGTNSTVLIGTDPTNQFVLLAGSRPEQIGRASCRERV